MILLDAGPGSGERWVVGLCRVVCLFTGRRLIESSWAARDSQSRRAMLAKQAASCGQHHGRPQGRAPYRLWAYLVSLSNASDRDWRVWNLVDLFQVRVAIVCKREHAKGVGAVGGGGEVAVFDEVSVVENG